MTPPRSEPTMIITKCAEVAQLVEHSAENAGVVSSILTLGTTISTSLTRQPSGSSSVVEHFLAKEGVGGSNPLSRSSDIPIPRVLCEDRTEPA